MKNLKEKCKNCELTIGSWISLGHPGIAEIMAQAGFEWLTVDLEHSSITISQAEELIRVIDLSGCIPLARVGENDALIIKRVMDAGAHGVIVPMVNSREDAVKAVESVHYPPKGKRGVGLARAQKYGQGFEEYKKWLAKESIIVVQIEHIDAINNLEEILSVQGVDASIVGPFDLSASMGFPGEFDRTEVKEAIKRYHDVCKASKKPAGMHVIQPEAALIKEKISEGFSFLAFSVDELYLGNKMREQLQQINESVILNASQTR